MHKIQQAYHMLTPAYAFVNAEKAYLCRSPCEHYGSGPSKQHQIQSDMEMSMSRLTRDGAAEPVSRGQILRHAARGQGNIHFDCSADHEQDWQPYPVDPYSAIIRDDHAYIHTFVTSIIDRPLGGSMRVA